MKAKCFFILLLSLLIAGCVPGTSTPTFDVELAIQQTLSAISTQSEESLGQLDDTEIPTQLISYTPTLIPTEIPTNTPTQLLPDFSGCIPPINIQEIGLVTKVIDGKTIEVIINSQAFIVQYLGITVPEVSDPGQEGNTFGTSATDKNRELVEGQIITLIKDITETDQNNYLLRYVFVSDLSGLFVNHELARLGYAIVDDSLPDIACGDFFRQAEIEARDNELGFWAPTPTSAHTSIPSQIPTQPPTPLPTPKPTKVPTETSKPPIPYITMTPIPTVTVTCWVSPSTIPGATNTTLTFYAQTSAPEQGLGFDVSFSPQYGGGQRGCIGVDGDGDGIASCEGSSGMLPYGKSVEVTFHSAAGNCEATYYSQ